MAFTGFSAAGVDLLQLNRLQNSKEFYEEHKNEIKKLAITPFYELIEQMTPVMQQIDAQFVTVPSRMVSRVRRDTRYTKDKTLYRANLWLFFRRARRQHESMPCYYFELHPEYWAWGCWGAWGTGEMQALRDMILHEDRLFLAEPQGDRRGFSRKRGLRARARRLVRRTDARDHEKARAILPFPARGQGTRGRRPGGAPVRYFALDFETGNASPLSACALGVSIFEDGRLVGERVSLLKPPACAGKFHWGNVRVNHIKENMVQDAPSFASFWRELAPLAEGSVLVAHNAMFDTGVLCACLAHYGLPMPECRYVCTVKVSQRVWPDLANHKLDTVSDYLGITLDHHEAGSDARAAGLILQAALRETGAADADVLADTIGMRMGRISSMGKTPCSIAKNTIEKRRTPAKRNL